MQKSIRFFTLKVLKNPTSLSDKKTMTIKEYFPVIFGVLKDFRVIGTVIVMILVIEFAKYVTSYKKKPPKPKGKRGRPRKNPLPEDSEIKHQIIPGVNDFENIPELN